MFVVLHGQTEWNREGRVQGRLDSPLAEHGRRQAVTAARILGDQNLVPGTHEIVCSPLGRTRETARIIARELGFDISAIRTEERLKEVAFGQWEGHTHAQVQARWPDRIAGEDALQLEVARDAVFRLADGRIAKLAIRTGRLSS